MVVAPPVELLVEIGGDQNSAASDQRGHMAGKHGGRRAKQKSAGLATSLAIHGAVLLVMFLLIAPANLGVSMLVLTFQQTDNEDVAEIVPMDMELESGAGAPAFAMMMAAPVPSLPAPPVIPGMGPKVAGNLSPKITGASGGGGDQGSGSGPAGSFFGIEANGHDFVYVLDMSGSMRGTRYQRATDELLRSVEELRPDQKFYVLLFSQRTTHMFGERSSWPKPIPATPENHSRLKRWLYETFEGRGTYPREAVRVALKMNPSAIFMLSDGSFDRAASAGPNSPLRPAGDIFSMVAGVAEPAPIHAIAFEDPSSKANMQKLASITGGEFRYEASKASVHADKMLSDADAAVVAGDFDEAELIWRTIMKRHLDFNSVGIAQRKLADRMVDRAAELLAEDQVESAAELFTETIRLEGSGGNLSERQEQVLRELVAKGQQAGPYADDLNTVAEWMDEIQTDPAAASATSIHEKLAAVRCQRAQSLADQGDVVAAIAVLRPDPDPMGAAMMSQRTSKTHQSIIGDFCDQCSEVTGSAQRGEAIQKLVQLDSLVQRFRRDWRIRNAILDLASEAVAEARAVEHEGDQARAQQMMKSLADQVGNPDLISEVERTLDRDERRARGYLHLASRIQRRDGGQAGRAAYLRVVEQYPGTLAAHQANQLLGRTGADAALSSQDREALKMREAEQVLEKMLMAQ
ncbi:vWA domain-containing protein [Rubripirellula lacrimiformis]|uniref:vWA domain-containing protein n=1 Tax=Rubripirellula lacrimiformis TaxID=1930273 RepID=UPI001C54C435|nr:hypothetical protein [Rubripirellula lacrimiformis]